MVDILHVLLHKATWLQEQPTSLPLVDFPVVQRMAMPNLHLLLAEQGTVNQNLLHVVLATVNPLLPVVPQKEITNLKHQSAVPNVEPAKSINRKVRIVLRKGHRVKSL